MTAMYQNPHFWANVSGPLSPLCFHWDVTHVSEILLRRRVQFLEHLLRFKRANQDDCVEQLFGTDIRNNLTLPWAGSLGMPRPGPISAKLPTHLSSQIGSKCLDG
jgi:hypothetical protein